VHLTFSWLSSLLERVARAWRWHRRSVTADTGGSASLITHETLAANLPQRWLSTQVVAASNMKEDRREQGMRERPNELSTNYIR
jgi:hypothetical protein